MAALNGRTSGTRSWLSRHDDAKLIVIDPSITQEILAANIDSTLEGGAKINREWLFRPLQIESLSAEKWAVQ